MLKKSLILLTVLSFAVVANGALPVGVEMMSSGDMENGGDATTPPLYWSDTGTGTVGVSSDTPSGSGQSLEVTGDETPGYDYGKYSHDYTDQSGYAVGTQIAVSYWYKGDVYTSTSNATGATELFEGTYEWTKETLAVTIGAGVNVLDINFYDFDYQDGLPLLIDNVVMKRQSKTFWTYTNPAGVLPS